MSENTKQNPEMPPEWFTQFANNGFAMPFNHMMGHPHQSITPEMAQYHAFMHAQAMQQQMMQQQAALHYQAMMAAQQTTPPPQTNAPEQNQPDAQPNQPQHHFANDPMMSQAQSMLDEAMGDEDAGMFKEILGSLGMNDKEFWKGALVGAAAALVLSNDKVRGKLMGALGGAGEMLKSGGSTVKDTAMNTASTVKENVSAGSEIFKDTYQAGKDGFKESVERHKKAAPEETPTADSETDTSGNI